MPHETLRLQIDGMTCASCVGRVEKTLLAADGVVAANVNLATQTATLTVHADTETDIAGLVTQSGYPASAIIDQAARDAKTATATRAVTARFWAAAALTIPVVILAMGGHMVPRLMPLLDGPVSRLIQFGLTTLVLIWPGRAFYTKGVPALLRRTPDMNTLVAIGTFAAWSFSTVVVFAPALLPAANGVYFEAAAVIITLILLGRLFEARAKGRTGDAVRNLIALRPATAQVVRDGVVTAVPVEDIIAGDLVHLAPGARVAVDGIVTQGASYIDEAMLTGEPLPVAKSEGSAVTGGSVNGTGALVFRVTRTGDDTALAQIVQMVQDAQGARLPIQDLVNKITGIFVPIILVVAMLTIAVWLVLGPQLALVTGVSVLIVACPCAMGLATPMSIMVGTGRAAELGVLFRGGDALQGLQDVKTVAFDKTGTLTIGKPTLTQIIVADGADENTVLRDAATVEASSEHPIGTAIVAAATARGLALGDVSDFASVTGMGVQARVDGNPILVGAARFMADNGIDLVGFADAARDAGGKGHSVFYVARNGVATALLAVADPAKPEAADMIARLHARGIRTAMITGDTAQAADHIATELGIDQVIAGVLPAGKSDAIAALKSHGAVAFVGDGINDAPALAGADVGIAIGTGTDVAIEAADVVLMAHDLNAVVRAIDVSSATLRNIRQNLFWAFAYNAALIPVAAGLLYPLWGILLSPMLAAGAMALSSVFVVTNALRLRGTA